jgi:hypothetical protein
VNPGGGSGWDERPLDIHIPDDASELDRDVLAYHREMRAKRRRSRLRRLTGPLRGPGTVMPLLASILAVCLVAGAMLSVATFSPATAPATHSNSPGTSASPGRTGSTASTAQPSNTGAGRTSTGARPSGSANPTARPASARPSTPEGRASSTS